MSEPSPEEMRAYQRGYSAGRRHGQERADASRDLFEYLVDGLTAQGMTLDQILDAQVAGVKSRRTDD